MSALLLAAPNTAGEATHERTHKHTHAIPTAIFSAAATPAITSRPPLLVAARRSRSLLFSFFVSLSLCLYTCTCSLSLCLPLPLTFSHSCNTSRCLFVTFSLVLSNVLCLCIYRLPGCSSPVPPRNRAKGVVRCRLENSLFLFVVVFFLIPDQASWEQARD